MNSKNTNSINVWKSVFVLPLICLYTFPAYRQVNVNPVLVNPIVNPVVTTNVRPVITSNVNSIINATVNPIVNATVNANVDPIVNATVNANVNPIVNPIIDANVNVFGVWGDRTEGSWFAEIKGDKIRMEFRSDDDENNWSSSSDFMLSDFPNLPRGQKGEFSLKREAGTMVFNGKFDENMGYGHYKFTADKAFNDFVKSHGITGDEDRNSFAFFMVNLKKSYVEILVRNGFKELSMGNVVAMASMNIDEPYIKMWRENGFSEISPNNLVAGKSMHVTEAYIKEIRDAGYKDISFHQLIAFKSQDITGDYIKGLRNQKNETGENELPPANQIVAYKSMNIDAAYVNHSKRSGMIISLITS